MHRECKKYSLFHLNSSGNVLCILLFYCTMGRLINSHSNSAKYVFNVSVAHFLQQLSLL